jgi:S1-C subfamily serine protease
MKHINTTAVALLALAGIPLVGQKAPQARRAPLAPEVADFDTPSGRSYLGVGVTDLNSDRVQALKLKDDRGVEVTQVDQDAPAGKAGIKDHDVIVGFSGTPVESAEQFKRLMRETPPGRTVALDVIREGQQQTVKVQVADRKKLESSVWPRESRDFAYVMPAMPAVPAMPAMPAMPRMWMDQTITRVRSNSGATLESLSPQLGDYFGVKNGEGLLVRAVQKGSAADAAGLRAGDVVIRVGDQKISDNSDWTEALRNGKNGKVSLVIMRDKKEQTLSMSVPPRRGPDSSALYEDDSAPDTEMAFVEVEPLLADGIDLGSVFTDGDVDDESGDASQAVKKGMKQLRRELIDNRGEINRNLAASMKLASAQLKAHSADIQRAMREAQNAMQSVRIECGSQMQ